MTRITAAILIDDTIYIHTGDSFEPIGSLDLDDFVPQRRQEIQDLLVAGIRQLDPARMSNEGAAVDGLAVVDKFYAVIDDTKARMMLGEELARGGYPYFNRQGDDERPLEAPAMADIGPRERELKYVAFPDSPAPDVVAMAREMDRGAAAVRAARMVLPPPNDFTHGGEFGGPAWKERGTAERVDSIWTRAVRRVEDEHTMDRFWVLVAAGVASAIGLSVVARWVVDVVWQAI